MLVASAADRAIGYQLEVGQPGDQRGHASEPSLPGTHGRPHKHVLIQ